MRFFNWITSFFDREPTHCYIGVHSSSASDFQTWKFKGIRVGDKEYLTEIEMFRNGNADFRAVHKVAKFTKRALRRARVRISEGKVATKFFTDVNVEGDIREFFRFRMGVKTTIANPVVISYIYELQGGYEGTVELWNDWEWKQENGYSRSCRQYNDPAYVDTFENEVTF